MLPDFIIIGAQKAGSTFVHYCLEEHPQIYMPHHEVHFFEDPVYREQSITELERLFVDVTKEKRLGIKRAEYLARRECAERIKHHCPEVQIIVVLRNPVERALSGYFHSIYYGFLPVRDAETGLKAILEGRYQKSYPAANFVIENGLYSLHLQYYLTFFKYENIHVLLFDELKREKLSSLQKLYRFLGVDDTYVPQKLNIRPQQVIYSVPRLRWLALRNPLIYRYDEGRTRSYTKGKSTLTQNLNRIILAVDRRVMKRVFDNGKPRLSQTLQKRLFQLYEKDIQRLEKLLARDLGSWKLF